jgi:radical SAM superfamily enzyme YgiQ (UPF0313 family)
MDFLLIYPSWPKLEHQTSFHLPPHGPAVVAAEIPDWVTVTFIDENVEPIPDDIECDFVGLSIMLTSQLPRARKICRQFINAGCSVICGGIATMLHTEDVQAMCSSVFLGEVEGRLEQVFLDQQNGTLKPCYNFLHNFPPTDQIGPARRTILDYSKYEYKGIRMADLFHASRGCKFNCFPCCSRFLGGKKFRPRPMDRVAEELATIENDRLFIVDNSLAQEKQWELELFQTLIPFKKVWCSHPIQDDDDVLALAVEAGAWYVYQAIFDMSDYIRKRIERYKQYGIGVEGTILLGTDDQDEEYIKRMIDFLMELDIDLAEFTVMTPFAHTPLREELQQQDRILSNDPALYDAGHVVFQPRNMTPEKLQQMYHYSWETFYSDEPQTYKMYKLYKKMLLKNRIGQTEKGDRQRNYA